MWLNRNFKHSFEGFNKKIVSYIMNYCFYLCRSICLCCPARLESVSFCCFGILPLIGSGEAVEVGSWEGVALFLPLPVPVPGVVVTSFSLLAAAAGFLGGLPRRGLLGGGCDAATGLEATLFSVPSVAGTFRFLPLAWAGDVVSSWENDIGKNAKTTINQLNQAETDTPMN